ncbi:AraC family transcriptional regulator [Bowmanella denitrificans]|uniref:AraC family transcriptional regulator n=1 Tax=Bowmanella denitrificans TaxID=366582 RepID=A0ABP3HHM9_9ALTE
MIDRQTQVLARIERAVALLQSHLFDSPPLDLAKLADAAALSPFHFHRLYRLVTGETCAQTISRLRLAAGARHLSAAATVTDAALQAGFSSSQAFAKAMKRQAHLSPSQLRDDPELLDVIAGRLSHPASGMAANPPGWLSVELVSLAPMRLMTVRTEHLYPDLFDTYGMLFEQAGGPEVVQAIIGMPRDDSDNQAGQFDSALLLSEAPRELPDNLFWQDSAQGDYLRTRHLGSFAGLEATVDNLYLTLLGMDDLWPADSPCIYHYLDDPEMVEESALRTDIYLPVVRSEPQ